MITTKEKLEKMKKLSSSLSTSTIGLASGTFVYSILSPGSPLVFVPALLNVGCITANQVVRHQIENYDENGYIKEMNDIYDAIIKDMVILSKDLDNKEVLEHYSLLKCLYRLGYLSYNSQYNEKGQIADEVRMLGPVSLNGHGVCRNTAVMTADYLDRLKFNNQILVGFHETDTALGFEVLLREIFKRNDVKRENLTDDEVGAIIESFKGSMGYDKTVIETPADASLLLGNHAITKCNDKTNSYYLDLSLDKEYIPYDGKLVSLDGETFTPSKASAILSKKIFKTKNIKDKDTLGGRQMISIVSEACTRIADNEDMLRKFHNDHQDMLERAEEIYQLKRVK